MYSTVLYSNLLFLPFPNHHPLSTPPLRLLALGSSRRGESLQFIVMAQFDNSSSLWRFFDLSPYTPVATSDEPGGTKLKPNFGQILRSKQVRFVAAAVTVVGIILLFLYTPRERLGLDYWQNTFSSSDLDDLCSPPTYPSCGIVMWTGRVMPTRYMPPTRRTSAIA